jgi:hypothetical protein
MLIIQVLEGDSYACYTSIRGGSYARYTCIIGAHMLVIQVLEGLICSLYKY